MEFNKSVVVFVAHPDDTEIFVAGTLKLLRDRGWEVTICTLTAGGMGGIGTSEAATIRIRKREAAAAAALLDAEYFCLDGRDGFLYDTPQLRLKAIEIIRRKKAGVVFTHLPNDYHSDHRATCTIVDGATMLASLPNVPSKSKPLEVTPLLYHHAPLGLTDPLGNSVGEPQFYMNIDSVQSHKMKMLACHQSQIELMRVMQKMDDFFGEMAKQDRYWGGHAGCEFAEAYWQHLGGGYQKVPLIQTELSDYVITRSST